jgi:hypothetical protein
MARDAASRLPPTGKRFRIGSVAYQESDLTAAQRSYLDEFATSFGHAPLVGGPAVEQALVSSGAAGAALLHRGEDFDPEYVVILRRGAIVPVDVTWDGEEVTISLGPAGTTTDVEE